MVRFSLNIKTFYTLFGKNKITSGQKFFAFPKRGTPAHLCVTRSTNFLVNSFHFLFFRPIQCF